ncbi:MAG: hypothetical protein PHY39_06465 [Endomicrobiaceae bacterium]|nr:hypothetical protein [Endomicrobiaceae bacterium]
MNNIKHNLKAFIQFSPLVLVISLVSVSILGYGGTEYYKISKNIKEAEQLRLEENYGEAIKRLETAKASLIVEKIGINKNKINEEIKINEQNLKDYSIFDRSLKKIEEGEYQEAINFLLEFSEDSFYYKDAQLKMEEIKREMVEKELEDTKIAKDEETTRRIQEEQERKIVEKKLINKESEEKRMNTDGDGDGLTYEEELSKGTSDTNLDSDGDGIIDGEDIHPAGGGRNIAQTFAWDYAGTNWTWTETIQEDWYEYYKAKPRTSPISTKYITSNDPFIKKISKAISEEEGDGIIKTWLAISFVQNLSYVSDSYTGYDEYPKYPIETFFEKNGDCEDTSYLAASIIDAMNIGSALIVLPGHMAIGVYMDCNTPGTYYKLDDKCYYYVETTDKNWAGGEIPDDYRDVSATLIEVRSGKMFKNVIPQYIKPCSISSIFPNYYWDGEKYYSDFYCNNPVSCLHDIEYPDYYWEVNKEKFYWDSNCNQIVVKGCFKSEKYLGYFYDDYDYYFDSSCIQKATFCRPSPNYSDTYYNGYNDYWDSSCSQKVVSWCSKSIYHPGYFFNSIDSEIYFDSSCTQKANLY